MSKNRNKQTLLLYTTTLSSTTTHAYVHTRGGTQGQPLSVVVCTTPLRQQHCNSMTDSFFVYFEGDSVRDSTAQHSGDPHRPGAILDSTPHTIKGEGSWYTNLHHINHKLMKMNDKTDEICDLYHLRDGICSLCGGNIPHEEAETSRFNGSPILHHKKCP